MWNMPWVRQHLGGILIWQWKASGKRWLSELEEGEVISKGEEERVIHEKQWKKLIYATIKQQSLSLLIVPFSFLFIYLFDCLFFHSCWNSIAKGFFSAVKTQCNGVKIANTDIIRVNHCFCLTRWWLLVHLLKALDQLPVKFSKDINSPMWSIHNGFQDSPTLVL